jgi:hypothetical protein
MVKSNKTIQRNSQVFSSQTMDRGLACILFPYSHRIEMDLNIIVKDIVTFTR